MKEGRTGEEMREMGEKRGEEAWIRSLVGEKKKEKRKGGGT